MYLLYKPVHLDIMVTNVQTNVKLGIVMVTRRVLKKQDSVLVGVKLDGME